jgi:class 3 adenylate cyclase
MSAPISYARSGDVNIACRVTGGGSFDLVLVVGFLLAARVMAAARAGDVLVTQTTHDLVEGAGWSWRTAVSST